MLFPLRVPRAGVICCSLRRERDALGEQRIHIRLFTLLRPNTRGNLTSVLNGPMKLSVSALSWLSPRLPTDGSIPAPAKALSVLD